MDRIRYQLREVFTFGRYLRQKFGQRISKIPISLPGFTCPNIDGLLARGGCIYCDNESFSPNLNSNNKIKYLVNFEKNDMLEHQLATLAFQYIGTSKKLEKKFKSSAFLVYLQSFSNTYAPLNSLKAIYESALSLPNSVGLSIGTRSDCISDELFEYLGNIAKTKEIWLEFGVQSVFDKTLAKINRAHDFASVENAISKAKYYGLNVCAHLIFGLPGENKEMCLSSVQKVLDLGIDSIKFHPLYAVKNTVLANLYNKKEWVPLNEKEYLDILIDAILMLPPSVSIQRFSAGDLSLLAPDWCVDKNSQMKAIRDLLKNFELIF